MSEGGDDRHHKGVEGDRKYGLVAWQWWKNIFLQCLKVESTWTCHLEEGEPSPGSYLQWWIWRGIYRPTLWAESDYDQKLACPCFSVSPARARSHGEPLMHAEQTAACSQPTKQLAHGTLTTSEWAAIYSLWTSLDMRSLSLVTTRSQTTETASEWVPVKMWFCKNCSLTENKVDLSEWRRESWEKNRAEKPEPWGHSALYRQRKALQVVAPFRARVYCLMFSL